MKPVLEQKYGSIKDTVLSTVLTRYKCKESISKLPVEYQVFLPFTVSTDDKKLVYVKNSKVACTSISHLMYQYSNRHPFEGNIHSDSIPLRHGIYHWQENLALLKSNSAITFSIVRHPESRCVSAFQNFFVDRSGLILKTHFKAIKTFGYNQDQSHEDNFNAFLDYVQASHELSPNYVDRHWRAQHINLGVGTVKYDHIGKLENLRADMEIVRDLAKIDGRRFEQVQKAKRNESSSIKFAVTAEQSNRIASIYSKDFELFGYS